MISRRNVLSLALGGLPFGTAARAQRVATPARIGWVSVFPLAQVRDYTAAFRAGLATLGLEEGRDITLDAVSADGDPSRLPGVVQTLADRRPVLILSQGAAIYEVQRIRDIPVVFAFSGDPVVAGLTDSLARPSRNLTGMTFMSVELNEKRVDLLHDLLAAGRRVVLMGDPIHPGAELEVEVSRSTAARLGLELRWVPTRSAADVQALLRALAADRPDALLVLPDAVMLQTRAEVAAFGLANRVPTMSGWRSFAESGGLMTYGPRLEASYGRLAEYVARILQGARAEDLPIERPTVLELVVNLKTAEAMGLTIPPAVMLRADEVIE